MIAGLLPEDNDKVVGGSVQVNGVDSKDDSIVWSNVVSYVDQIDRLHGYLTVQETLKFAFDCRFGGTHRGPFMPQVDDIEKLVKELDDEGWLVDVILRSVGLKRVEDTFVGSEKVRGVSGGEKVSCNSVGCMTIPTLRPIGEIIQRLNIFRPLLVLLLGDFRNESPSLK